MRRHVQVEGVRRWAGEHIIDLQAEPFKVIDAFFEEYGNCVVKGCGVLDWGDGTYYVEPGLVGLQGMDPEGNPTFKVAPFAGVTDVALPAYFVLRFETVEREYVDEKMHPIYYEYRADLVTEKPTNEPYLEITPSGAACFLDVTGVTHKLDQDGEGKDVTVSFEEAKERENVESGDTLSKLLGKVRKWFAGLQAIAFSGKTADLTDDAEHRMVTDTEKARWNDTYTKKETDDKDSDLQKTVNDLSGDVYHKADSYNRKEVEDRDADVLKAAKEHAGSAVESLGLDVYRKSETYNRTEIETKDTAVLDAAKKYVMDRISDVISGSPAALDTLYEIANALNNDPNFATTIMALINGKADAEHKHTKSQITDFPSSMPASDVYAWAKQSTKPSYSYSEVGAAAANHNHDSVYQPKGSYAAANHNHDSVYQPKGSYAAANHEHDTVKGNYTGNGGQQAPSYVPSGKVRFNMMNTQINGDGSYKDFLLMDTYTGGDVPVTTGFGISKSAALRAFIMQGVKGGSSWARSAELYTTANFNPSNYAAKSHTHSKSQITDFPSSMPASDVYAWAKQATKPGYTYSEVGAAAANHNHDTAYAAKSHTHSGFVTFHSRYLCGGTSSSITCVLQAGTAWISGRCVRNNSGYYTITHNLGKTNYIVILQAKSQFDTTTRAVYATLYNRTANTIEVRTADDSTANDALFFVDILLY